MSALKKLVVITDKNHICT